MTQARFKSSYSNKKVLITGGAGFVGSNLAHRLVADGAEVTVLDNFHPDYGGNPKNLEDLKKNMTLVRGDITDRELTKKCVSGADIVFHAAAQCSHVDSMIDPWLDLRYNCEGTLSILEAAKEQKKNNGKGTSIVYISTRAVIGAPLQNPATELTLPNPADVYGVNKMAAEYYCAVYARVFKIPSLSIRLTNSYGPRHQMRNGKYGILNWFMSLALRGEPIKVFGTGEQLRDYLYIDDAVDALARAGLYSVDQTQEPTRSRVCGTDIPYSMFNVASGCPEKFVECARKVVQAVGGRSSLELVPWPADRKAIETGDFVADSSEAEKLLGWKPKTPFDVGLAQTIAFYRDHLRHYL